MTPYLRFEILKRDRFTCRYCGAIAPDVALHVDHLRPVADGGTDEADNLVTACVDCNLGKSAIPLTIPAKAFNLHHRAPPKTPSTEQPDQDGPPLFIPVDDIYAFGPLPLPVSRATARILYAVRQMAGEPTSYGALGKAWGWKREKVRRFLADLNRQPQLVTAHPSRTGG